jgi:Glycosyltransferase family 87
LKRGYRIIRPYSFFYNSAEMVDASGAGPDGLRSLACFARRAGIFCVLAFAALNFGLIWHVRGSILRGYGDFASFYTAGQMVRSGESARLYAPALQWKIQQQFASTVEIRLGPLPYVRPPFEALLFLPFAYLRYPVACVLWMALQIALLLTVPIILLPAVLPSIGGRGFDLATYSVQALLCVAFFPVGFDLIQGQDSVLLLVILIGALRLLLRGADLGCGAVLALGLFKFHLVIPLLAILVLRKKWRAGVGFAGVGVVLLGISLFMVGPSGFMNYPKYLWGLNQVPGLGMVKPQSMPNLRGLLTVLVGNGALPAWANWFLAGVVLAGVIVASRGWRGEDRTSIIAAFSLGIVVTLATSYYANSYDLTLLLVPLLLLGKKFWLREFLGWPRTIFLLAGGVLLCTPLLWVLAMGDNRFRWVAIALFAMAVSIAAAARAGLQGREV